MIKCTTFYSHLYSSEYTVYNYKARKRQLPVLLFFYMDSSKIIISFLSQKDFSMRKQKRNQKKIEECFGTLAMSTPVSCSMTCGIRMTMSNNSPVILAAPTSLLPLDTIVIFSTLDSGAAISAATWEIFKK